MARFSDLDGFMVCLAPVFHANIARWMAATQRAIRAIHGNVPVKKGPQLSADLCQAEMAKIAVAQMLVVSQPSTRPWVLFYLSPKNGETPALQCLDPWMNRLLS